jgi:hypothetical protein
MYVGQKLGRAQDISVQNGCTVVLVKSPLNACVKICQVLRCEGLMILRTYSGV